MKRAILFLLISAAPALGFGAQAGSAFSSGAVGIEERLGQLVPLDTVFTDSDGRPVTLSQLVTKPTILALVYYRCPNVCDYLLTGLAGVLGSVDAAPGTDYGVVTVSIDPGEGPSDARKARRISLETIGRSFPPTAWRFLTGQESDIARIADSVGFRYVRRADGFDHPVALVILSPKGKIVRYMNGADFLPADLKLSLLEASAGRVGPTIARVLRVCFRVDPTSHKLVFDLLKVVATVTLSVAAGFAAYLVIATMRRRQRARRPS